jgi:hypothetical protein
MNIITNNRPRPLLALIDLPEKARAEFDYLTEDHERFDLRFVQYKGVWYDVADTDGKDGGRIPSAFKGWDEWRSESFWSGVLFKWANDYDVIVGRYYS